MIDLVKAGNEATINDELKGIQCHTPDEKMFLQWAITDIECKFLYNAYEKLLKLQDSGFVPKVNCISDIENETTFITENLGKSEPVTDEVIFRRNCALLLWMLKKHGVRHGDITPKNIIVKNNKPMLVDFHQSKFDHEIGEDKRPEGDAYWMWESALELSPDTSRHIKKWRAIRSFVQNGGVLDFGCAEGDYCLFSIAENQNRIVAGFDINDNAIQFARINWKMPYCIFLNDAKVVAHTHFDTIFFMSVYAHIKNNIANFRNHILSGLMFKSKQLFFETQLHGDGPGLPEHKTDDDVYKFLKQFGKVEKLVTIPVFGREPLARSVWRIT